MSKGYVYILTNPSMPGLVKIGKTARDAYQRSKELYQTGVPRPFTVYHSVLAPDCHTLELDAHKRLGDKRVSPDREFFEVDKCSAFDILEELLREQVEAWLDEFMPDNHIVHADEFVDLGAFRKSVYDAIQPSSIQPPDFPDLLYHIEGDDLAPAIRRIEKTITNRSEEYRKKKAKLKVVGEQ